MDDLYSGRTVIEYAVFCWRIDKAYNAATYNLWIEKILQNSFLHGIPHLLSRIG